MGCGRPAGRVVYCHNPAPVAVPKRAEYLGDQPGRTVSLAISLANRPLQKWDRQAARSADRYVVNSHAVQERGWQ